MRERAIGLGVSGLLVAAVAVVLVGCASRPGTQAADDPVCRREAYSDPQVRALIARSVPTTYNKIFDFSFTTRQEDARYAYRQAVLACMQRRGLISADGVEPVRQYPFSPLGF